MFVDSFCFVCLNFCIALYIQVNCTGPVSCAFSTFRGLSHICVHGTLGLFQATIYSEVYTGGTLRLDINSYQESWSLYCNSSDICIVSCRSRTACQKLSGHCFGQCIIDCDDEYSNYNDTNANINSILCPDKKNLGGNWTVSTIARLTTTFTASSSTSSTQLQQPIFNLNSTFSATESSEDEDNGNSSPITEKFTIGLIS